MPARAGAADSAGGLRDVVGVRRPRAVDLRDWIAGLQLRLERTSSARGETRRVESVTVTRCIGSFPGFADRASGR